ncbi:MAG: cation diffusion facilitator family transporter [Betaproteobacteria bacterium]
MTNKPIKFYFYISIIASFFVLSLKVVAWQLTESVGLYSDAVESIANILAAVFGLWMISVAQMPADEKHPYGHSKAEYFASAFEGSCIFIAAISIWYASVESIMHHKQLPEGNIGLLVSFVATAINLGVGLLLVNAGKKLNSVALVADGKHLLTDVWTTVGVVAGVSCAMFFKLTLLDAIIGLIVGAYIGFEAIQLISKAVHGLLDHSLTEEELLKLEAVLEQTKRPESRITNLATRVAGQVRFIRFNLLVTGSMTVDESHALCDLLEARIRTDFAPCEVDIHIEPLLRATAT